MFRRQAIAAVNWNENSQSAVTLPSKFSNLLVFSASVNRVNPSFMLRVVHRYYLLCILLVEG